MQWVPTPGVRSVVLGVFLIGLPVLAIPWVSQQLDKGLYGAGEKTVPDLIVHSPPQRAQVASLQDSLSPARFDPALTEREPDRPTAAHQGLDAVVSAPPLLAAPPAFAARLPVGTPNAPESMDSIAYAQQVRQKLEALGAQYVVLEEIEAGKRYRFAAQMLVSPRQPQVRPFEATASDPGTAARAVLADVESWRTAALPTNFQR